jgi:hypothetical protein
MAKALELSDDTLTAPPVPKAAKTVAATQQAPKLQPATLQRGREVKATTEPREPLQVRWPRTEVKAVKLAALQFDFPTVSDFMLACFHAYMKAESREQKG